MKKHYVKPTVRCIVIKTSSKLLQNSLPSSEDRHTYESFSRQTGNFDDWDDEE